MLITALDPNDIGFPDPSEALSQPNGLLAVGGDLSPHRLIEAYRVGIFPWYSDGEPLMWWSPNPRAIITPDSLHTSRSLVRVLKKHDYEVRWNTCFQQVIKACAAPRLQSPGTWILPEMQDAYLKLHEHKVAHSIEIWRDEQLIGGLYGIALGPFFFGESMFSTATNGSKIAIATLVTSLAPFGLECLDCQMMTHHLQTLGAFEEDRNNFTTRLKKALNSQTDLTVSEEQLPEQDLIRKSVLNIYLDQA
jgi:leucyl/phenylalanyl-tRNA--protein transferase